MPVTLEWQNLHEELRSDGVGDFMLSEVACLISSKDLKLHVIGSF